MLFSGGPRSRTRSDALWQQLAGNRLEQTTRFLLNCKERPNAAEKGDENNTRARLVSLDSRALAVALPLSGLSDAWALGQACTWQRNASDGLTHASEANGFSAQHVAQLPTLVQCLVFQTFRTGLLGLTLGTRGRSTARLLWSNNNDASSVLDCWTHAFLSPFC